MALYTLIVLMCHWESTHFIPVTHLTRESVCAGQDRSVYAGHGVWDNCKEANWEAEAAVIEMCWHGRDGVDQRRTLTYRERQFCLTYSFVACQTVKGLVLLEERMGLRYGEGYTYPHTTSEVLKWQF